MKARVIVVMFAPKTIIGGVAPSSSATVARASDTSSSHAVAAANDPPMLALRPLADQPDMASIAESSICVPAGPSNLAQSPATPGNRARTAETLIVEVCQAGDPPLTLSASADTTGCSAHDDGH